MSRGKKALEEAREANRLELDFVEKGINSFEDLPGLCEFSQLFLYKSLYLHNNTNHITVNMVNITRLTISHNKISVIPPGLANLVNLEILNLANNHIEELPVSISSMPKLRILNVSINRLNSLPRGFGAFPVLEILDLTYNNLNENTLPGNFFMIGKRFAKKFRFVHVFIMFFLYRKSEGAVFGRQRFRIHPTRNWTVEKFTNR